MYLPEAIAQTVISALPNTEKDPRPEQIEKVMRSFPVDVFSQRDAIRDALDGTTLEYPVDHWIEANLVVSGSGAEQENAISFLLRDTCTCVLDYLPSAIAHAKKSVDPRITALLHHKHFDQK